jgi:lipopolysaccharide/colanic/teichoic acid biosynthesis glycosyltransferase
MGNGYNNSDGTYRTVRLLEFRGGGAFSAPDRRDDVMLVATQEAVALMGEQAADTQKMQPATAAPYTQVQVREAGASNPVGAVAASAVAEDAPALGTPEFRALCEQLDHRSLSYRAFKRFFDFLFALIVVAIGLIPGALLCIAIAADTKGSPIYSQERIGKRGKPFRIYKFRSMVKDSDNVEKYFTPEQLEKWKSERKVEDDPRITKLGGMLRRTSIDEAPQFLNVLLGQISLIGPRVITRDELMQHFSSFERAVLLSVTPGVSGAWQAGPRNTASFENGLRQKIELSYARNANLKEDCRIFFKTIHVMLVEKTGK